MWSLLRNAMFVLSILLLSAGVSHAQNEIPCPEANKVKFRTIEASMSGSTCDLNWVYCDGSQILVNETQITDFEECLDRATYLENYCRIPCDDEMYNSDMPVQSPLQ